MLGLTCFRPLYGQGYQGLFPLLGLHEGDHCFSNGNTGCSGNVYVQKKICRSQASKEKSSSIVLSIRLIVALRPTTG